MASIQTGIELNDYFSSVLNGIISSVNLAVSAINEMQQSMNADIDTSSIDGARDGINQATAAYRQLTQAAGQIDDYIRDDTDEQKKFNNAIRSGTSQADKLMSTIQSAVTAYASIQTVKEVISVSDELTATTSRLDMMNESFNEINGTAFETSELVNKVYAAAQDSGGSFSDMAAVVAKFGNNAKDAFSSQDEVVAFADLVQKQMTIAGASTTEASNAMLQLSQALGSGTLRGDELNSIFEQAPNLIQNIADYLDVPIGSIREMASEGELTADIVKAAIFDAGDEINAKFESMPTTWGQQFASFKNDALMAFQPVLQRINDMANNDSFQGFVSSASGMMVTLSNVILSIFDLIGQVPAFTSENWSIIEPIIMGIVAALGLYYAAMLAVNIINGISAIMETVKAAAQAMATGTTLAQTAAQYGLNAALAACPLTWIIVMIIAVIAIIYAVCAAIAKMTGIANSGFGVITGGINVVIQFFKNLLLVVANIALGIGNAIAAVASNIMTAFHNAICSVQSWWYDLLSTALTVVAGICEALNKLPFVEFDYSGITAAADEYAAKASEAAGNKESYTSVADAFNEGFDTFDTFQDGWVSDAFESGASWGDGLTDSVSDAISGLFDTEGLPDAESYTSGFDDVIASSGVSDSLGSIADDTGSISDSMDITEEELKYMRDIAEQEAVNRFTTAEISVDMSGMSNNISNGMDLDGVMSGLTDAVNEAIETMAEGVHV